MNEPRRFTVYGFDKRKRLVKVEVIADWNSSLGSRAGVIQAQKEYPNYAWEEATLSPFTFIFGNGIIAKFKRSYYKFIEGLKPLMQITYM